MKYIGAAETPKFVADGLMGGTFLGPEVCLYNDERGLRATCGGLV